MAIALLKYNNSKRLALVDSHFLPDGSLNYKTKLRT